MNKHIKTTGGTHPELSAGELKRLLALLTDGIDGYESDHGDLRCWNREAV